MCGIVSYCSSVPVSRGRLEAATLALSSRGPDAQRLWLNSDETVGLGHRRLAIVDPEGGHQPVSNENETVWATVNGELYDFRQQRRQLESNGHRFRSRCDSEVVCHLYEQHGLAFVNHLRGEFALLLYDQPNRRLVAVRDHFGIKPLLYAQWEGQWWFASKARALFAAGLPARWSDQTFWQAASTQYPLPGQTFFDKVHQVPPSTMMVLEKGTLTRHSFSLPQEPQVELGPDWAQQFRQRLEQAVVERLPEHLPVALQLSGGIDSGAVVALAAQHRQDLTAFTVSYPDTAHDELDQARQLADRHGVPLLPVPMTAQSLMDTLPLAVAASEGVAVNAHLAAKYLLGQRIHQAGFKVVLTGEGADEVLLGYPHFRQDLASSDAERQQIVDTNLIAAGIMVTRSAGLSLQAIGSRLGRVPAFLGAKAALGLKIHHCLKTDFLAEFAHQDPFLNMLPEGDLAGLSPIQQSSRLWNQSALANYILHTLGDGCEMAHSLEGRLPFLDGRLAAWLEQVPLDWKIRNGQEKFLLRQACSSLLPPSLLSRQKQPFMAPPLLDQGHLQKRLREVSGQAHCFVDRAKLCHHLDRLADLPPAEQREWDPALTWLLTSYYLEENFAL
ncbi:asparagine synthase (glutamine-hydrolyzing) [bacterium]|nr:asparagine synthase (glutamine-hydrolyzing) [bacterium]